MSQRSSSRGSGIALPSLFGLEDKTPASGVPSSAVHKNHRHTLPARKSCTVTNATVAALPLSLRQTMVASEAPVSAPAVPPQSLVPPPPAQSMAAPTIQKLTKAEWKMVGKIKLVDFWGDEPFVTTYKIQVPTEVDTYYFWLTWNPVPGRPKKDRTAFSVADLNKVLLDGRLTFQLPGSIGAELAWLNAMPVRDFCAHPCRMFHILRM